MDIKLTNLLADLYQGFKAIYNGRLINMILYGSQARQEAISGSDIDVLIILDGPLSPLVEIARTSEIVSDLSLKYDEVISCMFVSSQEWAEERSSFLLSVQQEGVWV